MSDGAEPRMFRTLRGFLNGEEPKEANTIEFLSFLTGSSSLFRTVRA